MYVIVNNRFMINLDTVLGLSDNRNVGYIDSGVLRMITFRAKLAAKNQMTIPPQMQRVLHMIKGDEFEFSIQGNTIVGVSVLKPVPADLLTDDILAELQNRRSAADNTKEREISAEELDALAGKPQRVLPAMPKYAAAKETTVR